MTNNPPATGSTKGRQRRQKAAAQAARRSRRLLPLAIFVAGLAAGLVAYDFLHLRGARDDRPPPNLDLPPVASPPQSTATAATLPNTIEIAPPPKPAASAPPPQPTPNPRPAAASEPAHQPAVEISPAASNALLERAQAAFDQGNLDRAQADARRAAAMGNHETDALLGAIAFKQGHLDQAERHLRKALARDPTNPRLARQLQVVRAAKGGDR